MDFNIYGMALITKINNETISGSGGGSTGDFIENQYLTAQDADIYIGGKYKQDLDSADSHVIFKRGSEATNNITIVNDSALVWTYNSKDLTDATNTTLTQIGNGGIDVARNQGTKRMNYTIGLTSMRALMADTNPSLLLNSDYAFNDTTMAITLTRNDTVAGSTGSSAITLTNNGAFALTLNRSGIGATNYSISSNTTSFTIDDNTNHRVRLVASSGIYTLTASDVTTNKRSNFEVAYDNGITLDYNDPVSHNQYTFTVNNNSYFMRINNMLTSSSADNILTISSSGIIKKTTLTVADLGGGGGGTGNYIDNQFTAPQDADIYIGGSYKQDVSEDGDSWRVELNSTNYISIGNGHDKFEFEYNANDSSTGQEVFILANYEVGFNVTTSNDNGFTSHIESYPDNFGMRMDSANMSSLLLFSPPNILLSHANISSNTYAELGIGASGFISFNSSTNSGSHNVTIRANDIRTDKTITIDGIENLGGAAPRYLVMNSEFISNSVYCRTGDEVIADLGINNKANIASTVGLGTALQFDMERVYGVASPETGNITFNNTPTGQLGVTVLLVHQSGTAPTFGVEFVKIGGNYSTTQKNYISFQFISINEIVYTISQQVP